jgi:hypothetical protein
MPQSQQVQAAKQQSAGGEEPNFFSKEFIRTSKNLWDKAALNRSAITYGKKQCYP